MGLTTSRGPLAARGPQDVNYRIEGPAHRLFLDPFPRRVHAVLGGEVVLDTLRGALLHESGLLPQLYLPREDLLAELTPGDLSTHCPFKGDASYWSLHAGGRTARDAVWAYPEPTTGEHGTPWLAGLVSVAWDALDAWFDEDEEVAGHLRDPYHRVDVRSSGRHVVVRVHGEVVADTRRAVVCSETGMPNRWYVPEADVRPGTLQASVTHTVCPYKGTASYRGVAAGEHLLPDAAWGYPVPLDGVSALAGRWCFSAEGIETTVSPPVASSDPAAP